jgi:hypothetical protein
VMLSPPFGIAFNIAPGELRDAHVKRHDLGANPSRTRISSKASSTGCVSPFSIC